MNQTLIKSQTTLIETAEKTQDALLALKSLALPLLLTQALDEVLEDILSVALVDSPKPWLSLQAP